MSKIFSYITAIAVLFFIGPYLVLSQLDATKEAYIYSQTMDFTDKCMTTGTITPEDYDAYTISIYNMGNYDIELEHQSKIAYSREGGNTEVSFVSNFNEQILDEMYLSPREPEAYQMKNGDRIKVSVTKKDKSTAERILSFLGIEAQKGLVVNYTGTVGSTVME